MTLTPARAADLLDDLLADGLSIEDIKAKVAEGIDKAAQQVVECRADVDEALVNVFGLGHLFNNEIHKRVLMRVREFQGAST